MTILNLSWIIYHSKIWLKIQKDWTGSLFLPWSEEIKEEFEIKAD